MSDEESTTMSVPARLAAMDEAMFRTPKPLKPLEGAPPRRRGRPPGSRNKSKDGEVSPPQNLRGGGRPPSTPLIVDEDTKRKSEKKQRAAQYAGYIKDELNDQWFMFLLGVSGMPPEMIYVAGSIPVKAQTNPNLTELGNRIAIPTDVADSWGKLLAELSYTDAGKTVTKFSENNLAAVLFAAFTALYSTYRYSQQLKPIVEQIKAAQEMMKQQQNPPDNGPDVEHG